MSVTTKLMTWQDFAAIPDDGQRHELVRGELITMPPTETDHGIYASRVNIPLGYYVLTKKLGEMSGESGYRHYRPRLDPRQTWRSSHARLPNGTVGKGYFKGAPDLLVEVLSPSDRLYDVEEKVEEWLAAGARLVWVVNPRRKVVVAHRPGSEPQTFRVGDTLDAGDVVPGFTLAVADIFA